MNSVIWFVMLPSPNSHFLSWSLSLTLLPWAFYAFFLLKFYATHFSYLSTFYQYLQPHIHTDPQCYLCGDHFIRLFIPVFPFHYLFNFSPSSQTINQSPPARCKSSISRHLSTLFLLICTLVCLYAHCLFLYSLILSLCLSPLRLCVEYTDGGCYVILCFPCLLWSFCLVILHILVSIEPSNSQSISLVSSLTLSFSVGMCSQINSNDPTSFTFRALSQNNT